MLCSYVSVQHVIERTCFSDMIKHGMDWKTDLFGKHHASKYHCFSHSRSNNSHICITCSIDNILSMLAVTNPKVATPQYYTLSFKLSHVTSKILYRYHRRLLFHPAHAGSRLA